MVMDSVVLELEGQTEGKGPRQNAQNAQNAIPKPESRHGGCRWGLRVEWGEIAHRGWERWLGYCGRGALRSLIC